MIYVRLTCEWFATAPREVTDLALHLQETQGNLCHSHDYDFSSKLSVSCSTVLANKNMFYERFSNIPSKSLNI